MSRLSESPVGWSQGGTHNHNTLRIPGPEFEYDVKADDDDEGEQTDK